MKKYKVAIALIVNDKGEILLSKRARDPFKGKWALVAGVGASKIHGMTPEEGVIDEVRADLGTESFKGQFFFSFPNTQNPEVDENIVFIGKINENEIKINPECSLGIKWVSPQNKNEFKGLAFAGDQIMKKYFEQLRLGPFQQHFT